MRLQLDSPIINGSGIFSYPDVFQLLECKGANVGAWMTKSIGEEERDGNVNPIFYENYNSVGLSCQGIGPWKEEIRTTELKKPLIASVFGHSIESYGRVVDTLEELTNIAAYEINLSCPNVIPGEKSISQTIGMSAPLTGKVVSLIRQKTKKPIIAKLTPKANVTEVAKVAEQAGADYIACSNTFGPGIPFDVDDMVLAGKTGGYSGPGVKWMNVKIVSDVYKAIDNKKTGIIAYGGISKWEDFITYARAGAVIGGIGTAFRGKNTNSAVALINDVVAGVQRYLKKNNTTLEALRGTLNV
jgi:dihydroorotate dehydrogenase (NAD+) catalytic subunit